MHAPSMEGFGCELLPPLSLESCFLFLKEGQWSDGWCVCLNPDQGHCFELLGKKTLNSHSTSLHKSDV